MFGYNLTRNDLLTSFHYFRRQDAKFINMTELILMGLKLYIQIVARAYPSDFVLQIHCRLYCYYLISDLNSVSCVHKSSRYYLNSALENMRVEHHVTMLKLKDVLK